MISNGRHIFHRYDESLPYLPWVNAKLEPVDMVSVSRRMGHYLSALWPVIVVRLRNMFVVSVVSRCCLNVPMFNGCHIHVFWQILQQTLDIDGTSHEFALTWWRQPPSWLLVFAANVSMIWEHALPNLIITQWASKLPIYPNQPVVWMYYNYGDLIQIVFS